ncbi:MAG TPA: relaxase/mobilization nuclease domain-containing protein, partial [Puia sp.]|nr:relaxase/mobilization nuclease domain-containing protein [Puia sp.]
MVVKITSPHSMRRALNYNEKKVQRGMAECIHAGNFLKELPDMNFYHKMERFQKQIELNQRAKTNTLHISLNFDPSENMSKEKLTAIADDYMEKIGFGSQPYLIYMHNDAGHPHIHILTTNIQMDGKRIDTFNIGKNQSEKARQELELKYELVKAKGREHKKELFPEKISVRKLDYGKSDLKRSITNVLDNVLTQYKFTSLPELNALLRQYNIVADRGLENSRTFKNKGLYFRALDRDGNKIGVPIKASSIYSKPTLKNLEKKFAENELKRKPDLQKLRTAIDWTLIKPKKSLEEFIRALEKERVTVVVRRNEKGLVYGLTYIDHNTKSIFNGSDLGKEYSAKRILERCGLALELPQQVKEKIPEQISTHTHAKEFEQSLEPK